MKSTIIATILTLALGASQASADTIPTRRNVLLKAARPGGFCQNKYGCPNQSEVAAVFQVGTEWNCINPEYDSLETRADATGACVALPANIKSITVDSMDSRCRVTVYNTGGCWDQGIQIGVKGCYSNNPIAAYKVTCPDWK